MESQFLLFLLYIALVDIRERSYEKNDKVSYWLCNLLHNVPLALTSEEKTTAAYEAVCDRVDHDQMQKWLEDRKKEFYQQFPEFKSRRHP